MVKVFLVFDRGPLHASTYRPQLLCSLCRKSGLYILPIQMPAISHDADVFQGILAHDPLTADFSRGLLHSIPEEDKANLPHFEDLLQQCKDPAHGVMDMTRVEAAQELLRLLTQYLQ